MQGAGLTLAPSTPPIELENFGNSSSVPKPTIGSATRGPTSVNSSAAELMPMSKVYGVKPSRQPCEQRLG
eukprot:2503879-Amphidinium_carterae.1